MLTVGWALLHQLSITNQGKVIPLRHWPQSSLLFYYCYPLTIYISQINPLCVYRKNVAYIRLSAIQGFRHPLGDLKNILHCLREDGSIAGSTYCWPFSEEVTGFCFVFICNGWELEGLLMLSVYSWFFTHTKSNDLKKKLLLAFCLGLLMAVWLWPSLRAWSFHSLG